MDVVESFGREILNHFLLSTSPNSSITFYIDRIMLERILVGNQYSENEKKWLLSGNRLKGLKLNNKSHCVVAAALEMMIATEIEDSALHSINTRMCNFMEISDNELQKWYAYNQDRLWEQVSAVFKANKRILINPERRNGIGRYVQYQKKHRVISTAGVLRYSDVFIIKGIKPGDFISFKVFSELIDFGYAEPEVKKAVFNYFQVWDGRCYEDMVQKRSRKTGPSRGDLTFFLKRVGQKFVAVENNRELDLDKSELSIKWLSTKKTPLSFTKHYFVYQDDYGDWLPVASAPSADQVFMLITPIDDIPRQLIDLMNSGEIEPQKQGKYYFWIFIDVSDSVIRVLQLDSRRARVIELVGGIKTEHNAYLSFALPEIRILDTDSQGNDYSYIYLDSIELPVIGGKALLPIDIMEGKHVLKLWDSSDFVFSVEKVRAKQINPIVAGWSVDYYQGSLKPADSAEEIVVSGIECIGNLARESSENRDSAFGPTVRPFEKRIEYLRNRFTLGRGL